MKRFENRQVAKTKHERNSVQTLGGIVTDIITSPERVAEASNKTHEPGPRRPGYYLSPDDWPTDVPRDELSLEDVYEVLDTFDELYDDAVDGLRKAGEQKPDAAAQTSVDS